MTLPLVISVPHAGLRVPAEVASLCTLTSEEIATDSDAGAAEIYSLESEVEAFITTDVARSIVDLNRARNDRRADGAIKTHTCHNVPVYRRPLSEAEVEGLLDRYYAPYHERLAALAGSARAVLGVDCHTMAAEGPPVGPDTGKERPWVCVSNADGTCPQDWVESLRDCFAGLLDGPVRINDPFSGGYITRSRPGGLPWLQIELSRAPFLPLDRKHRVVLTALRRWCQAHTQPPPARTV